MGKDELREEVEGCEKCILSTYRNNIVPGHGDSNADVMLVGEAPGRSEDKKGVPFVGSAGQLLNALLNKAGLEREGLWITNLVKCRPPRNREPYEEETLECSGYLENELKTVKPEVVVAVGKTSANSLTGRSYPMSVLRGRDWYVDGFDIPLIVVRHPSYMLRAKKNSGRTRVLKLLGACVDRLRRASAIVSGEGEPIFPVEEEDAVHEVLESYQNDIQT